MCDTNPLRLICTSLLIYLLYYIIYIISKKNSRKHLFLRLKQDHHTKLLHQCFGQAQTTSLDFKRQILCLETLLWGCGDYTVVVCVCGDWGVDLVGYCCQVDDRLNYWVMEFAYFFHSPSCLSPSVMCFLSCSCSLWYLSPITEVMLRFLSPFYTSELWPDIDVFVILSCVVSGTRQWSISQFPKWLNTQKLAHNSSI